jgi:putative CocE/NonD family hydrolase
MNAPELKPTSLSDIKSGLNDIVVKTVHYGLQRMLMEKDVAIVMRDGVTLYANVFRPAAEGRYPVVLSADVYGKDANGMEAHQRFSTHGSVVTSVFTPFESPDPGFWVPNDYVVVKLALRGSSGSGGDIHPMSSMEARDYYEVIEWAAGQAWSSGVVGLNGVSYLCMTQWPVASMNPPSLKAISPWEGVSDWYRDWAFHGGIPETSFNSYWQENQQKRWPKCRVEKVVEAQKEHPLLYAYWADKVPKLEDIRMPMYVCASWSTQGLHTRGTLEGYRRAASKHKWLEIHGRKEWETYYSREALERQLRFFDYFLKGIENDWLETPPVRLEVRERFFDGQFRIEREWPLARTRYAELYLDAAGGLSPTPSKAEATFAYQADQPAGSGQAGARAVFRITFKEETELTGYMKLKLWVSAEGTDDMDLFVGIKKYDRRGRETCFPDLNHIENGQVAYGWLRVSHREIDPQRSTPWQPWRRHDKILKLHPGEVVPVEVEILPSATLYRKGETLELVVQGSDIVNPVNTPQLARGQIVTRVPVRHAETLNKGRHVLHTGGRYDSHLLIPLIPKDS